MNAFLLLAPYVLLPAFIAFLFRRSRQPGKWMSYAVLVLAVCVLPVIIFEIRDYFDPPDPREWCGTPRATFTFFNFIAGLPISIFLLYMFNKHLSGRHKVENDFPGRQMLPPRLPVSALMQCHLVFDPYFYNLAVDWALEQLSQGAASENIINLASFSKPVDSDEVKPYVSAVLRELNLPEKIGEDAVLSIAHYHIAEILNDQDIRKNLHALNQLAVALEYKYGLHDFFLLHHGWEQLEEIGVNFYVEEANLENIASMVKREGNKWIAEHGRMNT